MVLACERGEGTVGIHIVMVTLLISCSGAAPVGMWHHTTPQTLVDHLGETGISDAPRRLVQPGARGRRLSASPFQGHRCALETLGEGIPICRPRLMLPHM